MNITIKAVSTYYPINTRTIKELAFNAGKPLEWAKATGIKGVHVTDKNFVTTDVAARVGKKVLARAGIPAQSIDQLVFASEGISDYLYMDTSKTILQKIGGRTDGVIYSSDFFRGSNGTIGIIKFAGNQVLGNPLISASLIDSAVLWEHHSKKRLLGETFLGDGAGAIILQKDMGYNQVLSTELLSMSEYNMVTAFKYGGTLYDLPKEAVQNGEFVYDILDQNHLKGILENVASYSIRAGENALKKAGITIDDIDYIGISGFHKDINDAIISDFKSEIPVIDPLPTKGYLGSVGVIEVLKQFLNNDSIGQGNTMLVIANGIDVNVEAMVIRK